MKQYNIIKSNKAFLEGVRALAVKIPTACAAAAAFVFAASAPACAQTYENILQYREPVSNFNFDFTSTIIKFILATIICIVIILIMKKYMTAASGFSPGDNIKILDYQMISADRYIYIVEIYSKIFVLGVCGGGISKICEISDKETLDNIKLKSDKNIKGKMFSQYLQKFMPADKADTN